MPHRNYTLRCYYAVCVESEDGTRLEKIVVRPVGDVNVL